MSSSQKLSVDTKLEGIIRRVISPKTNEVSVSFNKKLSFFREEESEDHQVCLCYHTGSDDETHISASHKSEVGLLDDHSSLQQPFLGNLVTKSLVHVAPCRRKDSIFVPKDEMTQLQINDMKPRFHFARSETRYLSIHTDSEDQPKAYIQYKNVRRNKVFVLEDDCQELCALCLPDGRDLHCQSAYVIYSRHPIENDDYDLDAVQHDGAMFYPWLRVMVKAAQDQPTYQVWNGEDFASVPCSPESQLDTSDDTVVTGNSRTNSGSNRQRGAGFTILGPRRREGQIQICSSATCKDRGGWNVTVQAGADPAVVLCLTVVLGELIR